MTLDAADMIKSALPMEQVARQYGFKQTRAGFIVCPFHGGGNERTGSLKMYPGDRGWHCFGCHQGGDIIDFVMMLFDLSFKAACERLSNDFQLGIDLCAPVDTNALRAHRVALETMRRKQAESAERYRIMSEEYRKMKNRLDNERPNSWAEMTREYMRAVKNIDRLEWWLDENLGR